MARSSFTQRLFTALLLTFLLVGATCAAEAISFTAFDVPGATASDFLSQTYSVPGINDDGIVVGTYGRGAGGEAGFVRTPDGHISAPIVDPNNGSGHTQLYRVNDEDVMVGWYTNDNFSTAHSFFLVDGRFIAYDFPGAVSTGARGINNRGDITGTINLSLNGADTGFIAPRFGKPITFDAPAGATGFAPEAINDRRIVVGWYLTASLEERGFLRTVDGNLSDVVFPNSIATRALGINDCGTIVGLYRAADGSLHGFFGRHNNLQSLDVPGGFGTRAWGINNEGRVVGTYKDVNGAPHAFVTADVDPSLCGDEP